MARRGLAAELQELLELTQADDSNRAAAEMSDVS
jgi:hypothetical protein